MVFYTQLFTSNRGPLSKIWLAAHWERKLTKAHVFECNLETTIRNVKDIMFPKMKTGLRTFGHLLIGVVRIYSKKTKYLYEDCSDAHVKIKMAFRPGQTDLPEEGLEAKLKAITLVEDFTAFDTQLPLSSDMDVVGDALLNQCRPEEITLKEDFRNDFLIVKIDKTPSQSVSLLDRTLDSLTQHGDTFGDEDRGLDFLDFLTDGSDRFGLLNSILDEPLDENQESSTPKDPQHERADVMVDPMEVDAPALKTPLLSGVETAFVLEPVAITPNSDRKKGKRKRKLVVDQTKELSSGSIRDQLSDYSELIGQFDMAPPTEKIMQCLEGGGADRLFSQPGSTPVNPQIKELFATSVFKLRHFSVTEEVEEMRQDGQEVSSYKGQRDVITGNISVTHSLADAGETHCTELTALDHVNDNQETNSEIQQDENNSETGYPELLSEDSMFVHPSHMELDSASLHTQSLLDSQDLEEKRSTRRVLKLLRALKQGQSSRDPIFSVQAFCEGNNRSQAANTFFCFLVLTKQQAIQLHQSAPYQDISVTPGPRFYQ
ncbi:double-strand-break repair protein rad21-like protein 1 isoform X1 [Nothobranchius furzeri]|uniref:Transcript variant X1 n=1 Tax=Nothobranchius furzeri TaxID=105023 RepID=A0A9D3BKS0_NOTFU|nr:transcript variant X1 [Nothobranchius furzeri]